MVSAINFGISARIALALHMSEFLLQSPKRQSGWSACQGRDMRVRSPVSVDLKPIRYLINLYIASDCSSHPVDEFPPTQNE